MRKKQYTPKEIQEMKLKKFNRLFGFVPVDAIEKYWFSVNGKRLDAKMRMAVEMGMAGDIDTDCVVMD